MLSHTNRLSLKSIFVNTSMTIAIALTGVAILENLATPASAQQRRQSYGLGMPQTAGVGTTRTGTTLPSVALLVPSDGARTLSARPTFYWYIAPQVGDAGTKSSKITFFLREDPKISAKAVFRAEGTIVQPVYRFTLPKEAPELVIGKAQRWQIRWQEDIGGVESSVNVNAIILRENDPTVKATLAKTNNDLQQAKVYAAANYWYDALDAYTRWIEKNPQDTAARKERDELLAVGFQAPGTASQQITNVNALIANLNGATSQAIALTGRTR